MFFFIKFEKKSEVKKKALKRIKMKEKKRLCACSVASARTQHNEKVSQGHYVSMSMSTSLALIIIVSTQLVNSKYDANRVCYSRYQYTNTYLHLAILLQNQNA